MNCLFAFAMLMTSVAPSDLAFADVGVMGQRVEIKSSPEFPATVICFLGTECPLARLYGPRLQQLSHRFSAEGVRFVGVISNRQDTLAEIRRYAESSGIRFPVIHDKSQRLAKKFEATRTPEVFLLDAQLQVVYRGRIDDQYAPGIVRKSVRRHDLSLAIEQHLKGQLVEVPETMAVGCLIGLKPDHEASEKGSTTQLTYARDISRILQRHCVECHRKDDIAPFALEDYDQVSGWAETMLEVIQNGRMPPWHADPTIGHFKNQRNMPNSEKQQLREWVAGGMPRGDLADLPPPLEYTSGWQMEQEPDVILPMRNRPFTVPAQGAIEYQYFVVDPGLKKDTWINGAQIIPGERSVVHHAIAFIRPPDGVRSKGVGWLTAYVPGQRLVPLPPGYARHVPAGSKIVFQMHYTPTGTERQDTTKIGLVFADEEQVTHEVFTLIAINQEFEIPPNAASHDVWASVAWMPDEGELLSIAPHMHYRGKSFELTSATGNRLLSVPNYDFNWQHSYQLLKPAALEDLGDLKIKVTFDNSEQNPFNPDPSQWVTWGDQTWEEMAVGFFEVAQPRKQADRRPSKHDNNERQAARKRYVDDFLKRTDTNGDGRVTRSEASIILRFSFRGFDRNDDGTVTVDELQEAAKLAIR